MDNDKITKEEMVNVYSLIKKDVITPHELYLWWLSKLSSQRQEIVKEIEKLKIIDSSINDCHCANCKKEIGEEHFNHALDTILSKLKNMK